MIYILIDGKKKPLVHFTNGGKWVRPWFKDELKLRSPNWIKLESGAVAWEVPKSKTEALLTKVHGLGDDVKVTQRYKDFTRCNDSCKWAASAFCECSCLGLYHGRGEVDPDFVIEMKDIEDLHMHQTVHTKETVYRGGIVQRIDVFGTEGSKNLYTA